MLDTANKKPQGTAPAPAVPAQTPNAAPASWPQPPFTPAPSAAPDAWSGEPESRRQIEMSLAAAGMDTPTLAVSRSYLDRVVAHELALSIEKREAPPFGLLQVAETIGGADWQPARMAFGKTLAGLIAEVPKAMCELERFPRRLTIS